MALALLACGKTQQPSPEQPPGDVTSPSERLEAWQLVDAEGEALTLGIFDTQEQQHCRFALDREGELRCLPQAFTYVESTRGYADAACQRPIFRALLPGAAALGSGPVALPLSPEGCEQRYALGTPELLSDSAPRYFKGQNGCTPGGGIDPFLEGKVSDLTLREVDSDRYVLGREKAGPLLGERLRIMEVEVEGDARFQSGLRDERWARTCWLGERNETSTCLPPSLSEGSSYFSDESCQTDALYRVDACSEAAYIGDFGELYALGEPWTGTVFEQGKVCGELNIPLAADEQFLTRGQVLGADATMSLDWLWSDAPGATVRRLRGDAGEPVAIDDALFETEGVLGPLGSSSFRLKPQSFKAPRFFDNARGEDCSPVWTFEGEVRCAPKSAVIEPYHDYFYLDPECSEPAYLCYSGMDCIGDEVVLMGYDQQGEYRAVSRNTAATIDGPVYQKAGGSCSDSGPANSLFFTLSEPLPWDDYPLLTEINGRASGEP